MNTERKVKTVRCNCDLPDFEKGEIYYVEPKDSVYVCQNLYSVTIHLNDKVHQTFATHNPVPFESPEFIVEEFHEEEDENDPKHEFILNSRIDDANWEIQIGSVYNLEKNAQNPAIVYYVSDDVKAFIDTFANREVGEDLVTTYVINKVKFKMIPKIKFKP